MTKQLNCLTPTIFVSLILLILVLLYLTRSYYTTPDDNYGNLRVRFDLQMKNIMLYPDAIDEYVIAVSATDYGKRPYSLFQLRFPA